MIHAMAMSRPMDMKLDALQITTAVTVISCMDIAHGSANTMATGLVASQHASVSEKVPGN